MTEDRLHNMPIDTSLIEAGRERPSKVMETPRRQEVSLQLLIVLSIVGARLSATQTGNPLVEPLLASRPPREPCLLAFPE